MVSDLNRRFSEGAPSNSLEEAGVLVHMFDNTENWSAGRGFEPCTDLTSCKNGQLEDHWSCSVINKAHPTLFTGGAAAGRSNGGIILNPRVTELLCAYGADVGSHEKPLGGCQDRGASCLRSYSWDCAWPPTKLKGMMKAQTGAYNEVIVASQFLWEHMPDAIDAFMYVGEMEFAVQARRQLIGAYGRRVAAGTPLVHFSSTSGRFTLA